MAWRDSGFPLPQKGYDLESACYGEKMAAARREMASTSPQTTVKPGQPPAAQPPTTPADTHSDDDEDPPSSGPPATVVRRSFTFADFFDKEVIAAWRERIKSELDKKEFDSVRGLRSNARRRMVRRL